MAWHRIAMNLFKPRRRFFLLQLAPMIYKSRQRRNLLATGRARALGIVEEVSSAPRDHQKTKECGCAPQPSRGSICCKSP
jgi:hypothetical protein